MINRMTETSSLADIAKAMHCREYRHEISKDEEKLLKQLGYVVAFGYSDDLVEFRGAINDEGTFGYRIALTKSGLYSPERDGCEDCPHEQRIIAKLPAIQSKENHRGYFMYIFSNCIEWAGFDIFDAGQKYCRGIVFSINDRVFWQ